MYDAVYKLLKARFGETFDAVRESNYAAGIATFEAMIDPVLGDAH